MHHNSRVRAERIELSERDSLRVLELLENPPRPTPALMAAARRRAAQSRILKLQKRGPKPRKDQD